MNRNHPAADPAAGPAPRPSEPPAADSAIRPAADPDDSGVGEEDPGAALDDPAVRDALSHEVEPADRARSNQRSDP